MQSPPRLQLRGRRSALAATVLGHLAVHAFPAIGALALALGGCAREAIRSTDDDLAKLEIVRYRYETNVETNSTRIVAEVRNLGDKPVKEATVTAILRGDDGESRGENWVVIKDIGPGESRVFGMTVMSHGRERDVEFRIGRAPAPTSGRP